MPRYIALLRAINVGGHTVKMERLRELIAALGFSNVETFIASGNVIFDARSRSAAALEKKIDIHLETGLSYAVATFIRSPAELSAIAAYQPFPAAELAAPTHTLYVAFVRSALLPAASDRLLARRNRVDDFHAHGREVYWLRRREAGETKFLGPLFEKTLGQATTVRNATTIRKLAALIGEPS